MNDNTILRIKVPAHLYESVKEQLTINEAAKSKKQFGAEFSIVKEKKAPKKGMEKVEEDKGYMGTDYASSEDMAVDMIKKETKEKEMKTRTLDELNAAKAKLEKKIAGMKEAKDVPYDEIAAKAINMALENGNTDQSKLDILTTLKDAAQKKIESMHSPARSEKKISDMEKAGIKEDIGNVTTGAEMSANSMMNALSGGAVDPALMAAGLVIGLVAAVAAGTSDTAKKIKDSIVGIYKGLKDPLEKEKVAQAVAQGIANAPQSVDIPEIPKPQA